MLYFLGFILLIMGAVMFVPVPVALFFGEEYLIPYFAGPAAIALVVGVLLRRRFRPTEPSLGSLMVAVAFSWIILCFFSTVPYVLGNHMSFIDGYFESMSGFTTTGLSMISNIEAVPRTILFWHSFTQWVGGIGIVVLFLAALVGAGKAARKLYVAEARVERIEPSIRETARSLWKIYVLFTLAGIVGFFFIGRMSVFESVNHAMSAISTGGFGVRNTSFEPYGPPALLIAMLIMITGATSFVVHKKILAGQWREFFRNVEVRLMLMLIALGIIILIWSVGLKHATFQSVSAISTTGFQSVTSTSLANWGDLQKGVLTMLMIIGAGYGSTGGAIKLIRTLIVIKAVYWMVKRSFLPERAVMPMKISGRIYTEQEVMETAVYAFIYILVLVGGAAIIMMLGNPGMNSLFESASAQGNVGLSVGITSAAMPVVGKIVFIIQMLVGRLEILPVAALLSYLIVKARPRPRAF